MTFLYSTFVFSNSFNKESLEKSIILIYYSYWNFQPIG